MTLRQKQSLFARHVALLILRAIDTGYESTGGEWHRPDATAELYEQQGIGIANSLHRLKLAFDLHLFKGGRYLSSTESHRPLGEWWEQQHDLARWGGRFGDGNHYSFAHGGRR